MQKYGQCYRSLEDQVEDLLKGIVFQRRKARQYNKIVIHLITLMRIKPVDRAYFEKVFRARAKERGLDLTGVRFLETSTVTR